MLIKLKKNWNVQYLKIHGENYTFSSEINALPDDWRSYFSHGLAYNLQYTDRSINDGDEMSKLLIWNLNFQMNTDFPYWQQTHC